ncbi:DNA-directed RNA polymerase subunit delta [Virgibacillus sp. 179-BFC.A HS]|uniref:RNAP delta factor n=1 Tax=Tigheibacillus jepli TaxID=3035914 RepID=A0ABU5CDX8_9BACI|nr:DNA-directed RNA polymerase subunit delta [Virgibacillus sp. 179-BFC.A HS]MDY0404537.1 DNA-directed RNA polymerase subunit delta [Virgibacillus sp. 179-BFC.A HS]
MSLKSLDKDKLKDTAMIDLAIIILKDEKKAMDFHGLYDQIAEIKQLTPEQKDDLFVQFYTDLNLDGRFLTLGSNMWGLKRWYPVEQIDEEITAEPKKRKPKRKRLRKRKLLTTIWIWKKLYPVKIPRKIPFWMTNLMTKKIMMISMMM